MCVCGGKSSGARQKKLGVLGSHPLCHLHGRESLHFSDHSGCTLVFAYVSPLPSLGPVSGKGWAQTLGTGSEKGEKRCSLLLLLRLRLVNQLIPSL